MQGTQIYDFDMRENGMANFGTMQKMLDRPYEKENLYQQQLA